MAKNDFSLGFLQYLMTSKISISKISKSMDRLHIDPCKNLEFVSPNNVKVAVCPLEIQNYSSIGDYLSQLEQLVRAAAGGGAQLICFPEYSGVLPAFALPSFEKTALKLAELIRAGDSGLKEEFRSMADNLIAPVLDAFLYSMEQLSGRFAIPIMAGSALVMEDDKIYNRFYFFSSSGEIVSTYDKIHLSSVEKMLGIEPGKKLEAFDCELGRAAMLAGNDLQYFEPVKILSRQGTSLLCTGWAKPAGETDLSMIRAAEGNLFILKSHLLGGSRIGTDFNGVSSVLAPFPITREKDGVMARVTEEEGAPPFALVRLDLEKQGEVFNIYTYDTNTEFYKEYLLSSYEK